MTRDEPSSVYLSALDRERFGYNIARAMQVTGENVSQVLEFCHDQKVEMLIARCNTSEIDTVQFLEKAGFLLMDTLVYDVFDTRKRAVPSDTPTVTLRTYRHDDYEQLQAVARLAFHGHFGHYHADKRLDPRKADDVYTSWIQRCCESREVADDIIVAEDQGKIVAFAPLRIQAEQEGEMLVGAVLPDYQGRGIFRSCTVATLQWFDQRQIPVIWLSTLINNLPIRKIVTRLGFEPAHSFYTFHKWFDNDY
jgi:ribosomal protein S18 acetylase RimI-like enzyme